MGEGTEGRKDSHSMGQRGQAPRTQTNKQTNEQANKQLKQQTNKQSNKQSITQTNKQTNKQRTRTRTDDDNLDKRKNTSKQHARTNERSNRRLKTLREENTKTLHEWISTGRDWTALEAIKVRPLDEGLTRPSRIRTVNALKGLEGHQPVS